jgi:SpoVK/Ycf46/Vps4 family AAA+-type ATPase
MFLSSQEQLFAQLGRIDLLVRSLVTYARTFTDPTDPYRGLYISDDEAARLASAGPGLPRWLDTGIARADRDTRRAHQRLEAHLEQCRQESEHQGVELRLERLISRFGLDAFERDVVLVCLAHELDPRYGRLYAYLQDDVTRRRPTVNLALNLFVRSFEEKVTKRARFSASGCLLAHRIVALVNPEGRTEASLLDQEIRLDPRIISFLLGSDCLDPGLTDVARLADLSVRLDELLLPGELRARIARLAAVREPDLVLLVGPPGSGRKHVARALCDQAGHELLVVRGEAVFVAPDPMFSDFLDRAIREARLRGAALFWEGFEELATPANRLRLEQWIERVSAAPLRTFAASGRSWEPAGELRGFRFEHIRMPPLSAHQRRKLWDQSLGSTAAGVDSCTLDQLASRFRFSGGRIRDAVESAQRMRAARGGEKERISRADLFAAARLQSNHGLEELAQKIEPHYCWDDLILPSDQKQQLQEISDHVAHRSVVLDTWGFGKKLSTGKGLAALFSGPSGTGKTMAAEIIAGELELDLYRIDLANVVSKYIGETEKNLARVFEEAETSNAILFFDEADALFGKRSEVKDAHDRYANIEVGYLLQRMETFEGISILATNARTNMDTAFVRRMAFSIHFPFPDAEHRRRIWEGVFPESAPRQHDLDFMDVADRFEVTGGNIKNIALTAAFMAAANGQVVLMEHVIRAVRREFQKMGRACARSDFGPYYNLLDDAGQAP